MQATANQVRWVPIEEIIDPEGPMQEDGPVQLCRRPDGLYTLLSGRGSLRRMRQAGQLCVDAVLDPTEQTRQRLSALLDKLVRGSIHYLDEAEAYRQYISSGEGDIQDLAAHIGRTPATIRKKLRLNSLGTEVGDLLRRHGLCESYAQELLRVPGIQGRVRVLQHVIDGGLTVKETEKLVDDVLSRMPVPVAAGRRMKPLMRDYRLYLNAIRGIVEQMRDAGLDATIQITVGKTVAEARIVVPIFK